MKKNYLSLVAIVLALIAIAMCSLCCLTKNDNLAVALKEKPEIIIEALQSYEARMEQEQVALSREIISSSVEAINNDANSPFFGPAKAKVTLALFFDYSCGYCHQLYPILKTVIAKNPDVKFVFKPLDLLGEISQYSARAVIAANEQGKFAELNDALFGYEGQLTEAKIDELAVKVGVDLETMKKAMTSSSAETLDSMSNLARTIQIRGVPSMILNGTPLQTFDIGEIQGNIDALK